MPSSRRALVGRRRVVRMIVPAAAILMLTAGVLSAAPDNQPVAPGPVLIVPACPTALEVAVPLPHGERFERARAWQLVELGTPGVAPSITTPNRITSLQCSQIISLPPYKSYKSSCYNNRRRKYSNGL